MPDPNWQPENAPQGNRFLQKLGVYLLGVAIGLVFLGWVQYRKHAAVQASQRSEQVQPADRPGEPSSSPDAGVGP
jgi:hypothetical protein